MTNKPDSSDKWRVRTRHGEQHLITATSWHVDDDGFIYFGNGGNSCAAAFNREDVVSIVNGAPL